MISLLNNNNNNNNKIIIVGGGYAISHINRIQFKFIC